MLPEASRSYQKLPEATKTSLRLLDHPRTTLLGWVGFYLNLNLDNLIIRILPTPEPRFLEPPLSGLYLPVCNLQSATCVKDLSLQTESYTSENGNHQFEIVMSQGNHPFSNIEVLCIGVLLCPPPPNVSSVEVGYHGWWVKRFDPKNLKNPTP